MKAANVILSLLCIASTSCAQTTLQPVFALPLDGTSTIFESTVTSTSSLDCSGSSLVVSTFRAVVSSVPPTPTATTTETVTTSESFVCSLSATTAPPSTTNPNIPIPSASPFSNINPTAQTFINDLSTAFLYASLFGNGGNQEKLCSIINPAGLDEITNPNINGTGVLQEVCALGSIQAADTGLFNAVVAENQNAVSYLATALFAVQVASGYAGGTNLNTLCSEINATLIDNIFIGFIPDVGTAVKNYVCSAAGNGTAVPPQPTNARRHL